MSTVLRFVVFDARKRVRPGDDLGRIILLAPGTDQSNVFSPFVRLVAIEKRIGAKLEGAPPRLRVPGPPFVFGVVQAGRKTNAVEQPRLPCTVRFL